MSLYGQNYTPLYSDIYHGAYELAGVDPLVFHALTPDPLTFEIKNVLKGIGDLTEARTGSLYMDDHEQVWRKFKTTVAAWKGGRVVENLCRRSGNFAHADWTVTGATKTTGVTDKDGGTTAVTITATSTNGLLRNFNTSEGVSGKTYLPSLWVRRRTGTGDIQILRANGAGNTILAQLTSSWQRFVAINIVTTDINVIVGVKIAASGDEVDVCFGQAELVDGRADTETPSEYIPTTAAPVQKVFGNVNGNSVSSNVVTEAVGAELASAPFLIGGPARTNEIIQSYDLTDAAWTAPGISVLDQVGMRGDSNGACMLTDGNSGVLINTQESVTIPNDGNIHVSRIWVGKDDNEARFPSIQFRLLGGTLQRLALDVNTKTGATVERIVTGTVAHELNQNGNWWELLISVANNASGNTTGEITIYPAFGTTIGASDVVATGSIIVGNVELHLNTTIESVRGTPPIFTSGAPASINAPDISFDLANHTALQGGYFIEWQPQYATSEVSGNIELLSLDNNAGLLFYDSNSSLLVSGDGTNTATVALTIVAGTTYKCWVAYGSNLQVGFNGTTGTATNYDGAFATGTKIEVITPSNNVNLVRGLRGLNTDFASAVIRLQALAA